MHPLRAGLGLCLSLAVFLAMAGLSSVLLAGLPGGVSAARAQSLTPPAGQARATAPGGRKGRGHRHGRRHRR